MLRLLGKDADPSKSREHVLLSVLAERRMQQGHSAELGSLLDEVLEPPVDRIGALDVDDFLPERERRGLAAALNTLLASPTFASWRQGVSLDVRDWLTPKDGRTPAVIVSVAHLDDEERTLVLGVLLEEIRAYTRSLPAPAACAPWSSSTSATACLAPAGSSSATAPPTPSSSSPAGPASVLPFAPPPGKRRSDRSVPRSGGWGLASVLRTPPRVKLCRLRWRCPCTRSVPVNHRRRVHVGERNSDGLG